MELTPQEIQHQASKLDSYVRRGGEPRVWLDSKGFSNADRQAILEAATDLPRTGMNALGQALKSRARKGV